MKYYTYEGQEAFTDGLGRGRYLLYWDNGLYALYENGVRDLLAPYNIKTFERFIREGYWVETEFRFKHEQN